MREAMTEAFQAAADDPAVMAPKATRDMVESFLQNQGTVLDKVPVTPWPSSPLLPAGRQLPRALGLPANAGPSSSALVPTQPNALAKAGGIVIPPRDVIPPMRGSIPATALMDVRSNIRKEAAQQLSGKNPDYASAQLLGNAEKTLSEALQTHLPKKAASKLRAVDRQYRKYKVVEDAMRNAGDSPSGVRPTHLERAIKSAQEGGSYARGEGAGLGELRNLSSAGREVFDTRIPMTGARYLTAGPLSWATSPLAALANTRLPKGLMTGTTAPQQWAQALEGAIGRRPAISGPLRMGALRAAMRGDPEIAEMEKKRREALMLAEALGAR